MRSWRPITSLGYAISDCLISYCQNNYSYNNVYNPLPGTNSGTDHTRTERTLVTPCMTNFWTFRVVRQQIPLIRFRCTPKVLMTPVSQLSGSTAFNASSEMATSIVQLTFYTLTTTTVSCSSDVIPCDRPSATATKSVAFEATLGKGVLYSSTTL